MALGPGLRAAVVSAGGAGGTGDTERRAMSRDTQPSGHPLGQGMNGNDRANLRAGFTTARAESQWDPWCDSEAGTEPISYEDRARGRIRAEFQKSSRVGEAHSCLVSVERGSSWVSAGWGVVRLLFRRDLDHGGEGCVVKTGMPVGRLGIARGNSGALASPPGRERIGSGRAVQETLILSWSTAEVRRGALQLCLPPHLRQSWRGG